MTNQELIEVYRYCSDGGSCAKCPATPSSFNCSASITHTVVDRFVDRFEAILAENEQLKAERDHFRDLTKKLWCEKQYGEDTNVPTKSMAKYVNLDDVIEHLELHWGYEGLREDLYELPTADVAPVRHERLIETGMDEAWCSWGNCTACGGSNMMGSKYCNWCGAKLDGGAENG